MEKEAIDMEVSSLKLENMSFSLKTERMILELLKDAGTKGLSRTELCAKTGYPRTTVYDALVRLQIKKLVGKRVVKTGKRGRPQIIWYYTNY